MSKRNPAEHLLDIYPLITIVLICLFIISYSYNHK